MPRTGFYGLSSWLSLRGHDPNGNITFNVYDDVNHSARTYVGWNTSPLAPTGPTQVSRRDRLPAWGQGRKPTTQRCPNPNLDNVTDATCRWQPA